jgi:hypothetical protein
MRDIVQRNDDTATTYSVPLRSSSIGDQRDKDTPENKLPTAGADSLVGSLSAENSQKSKKRSNKRKPSSSPQKAVRQSQVPTEWYPTVRSKKAARDWLCGYLESKIMEESKIKKLPDAVKLQIQSLATSAVCYYVDPTKPPAHQVIAGFTTHQKGNRDFRLQSMKLDPRDFPADFYQQ